MMNIYFKKLEGKSAFLIFSPFLLFYIILILKFYSPAFFGDESRYYFFANNLLHGFYSPPAPDINLWNGPGYPLFLTPFFALKIPPLYIVLLNGLFYYFSIILLFKIIRQFTSFKLALLAAVFWGCYYNSYQDMLLMVTETITAFLITLFLFLLLKAFDQNQKGRKKYMILAGLLFGYIILVKIIFAYVLVILLAGLSFLYLIYRKSANYKTSLIIMLIAFATILPYLAYTYNLTGRLFYLGNSGGMSLYCMTTTNPTEYGDWFDEQGKSEKGNNFLEIYEDEVKINHQKDYAEIFKYTGVERDDAYKRIALKNIKSDPFKFFENFISNIGRLLFSHPYSYTLQSNKNLLRLPLSGIVVVLMLYCLIPTLVNWKKIFFPLRLILFFTIIYLGLSSLLSAYTRMFTLIVPVLVFWISFILYKTIKIKNDFK